MDAGRTRPLAIAGLLLAVVLIGASLSAGWRAAGITGPGTLVQAPDDELWIAVGDELWRASADGHLRDARPVLALGLPAAPANLLRHPDGRVVATVRDDPTLYLLDPASAEVVGRVMPRWPADLRAFGGEAINLAVAPDGRVAIATGGGHAVALFDAQGRFLARTAPGAYRFTNGLWWDADGTLWTTDTNRFALRQLDGRSLAELRSIALPDGDLARYLGPARGAPPQVDAMAALIRYRNGMVAGRVVIVRRDGSELPLPQDGAAEPVDVAWLGDRVLASDGAAFSVAAWTDRGEPRADFGDGALRQRLGDIRRGQARLELAHRAGLAAGVAVFALALLLALRDQRAARVARVRDAGIDLSRLGTPPVGAVAFARLVVRLVAPAAGLWLLAMSLRLPPVLAALHAVFPGRALVGGLLAIMATLAALAVGCALDTRRLARRPGFEPLFNALAVRKLRAADRALLPLDDGEQVLETFVLQRGTPAWVVWTTRRAWLFRTTRLDHRLDLSFELAQVASLSTRPGASARGAWPARAMRRLGFAGWLEIVLHDGRAIVGAVTVPAIAERLAARFAEQSARPATTAGACDSGPRTPARAIAAPAGGPSRMQAAIASALVPGAGQWWQRRLPAGLLLFVPWAVSTLAVGIPLAWTVAGVRADVRPSTVASVLALQLGYAALSAWDAWRMGPPRA